MKRITVDDSTDPTAGTEQPAPTGDSAFQRAWQDAGTLDPPAAGPAASTPLGQRAQARLTRGSTRIATNISTFAKAEGHSWQDRGGRWFCLALGCFCAGDLALHRTLASLAVVAVGWLGAAFYYGGPAGEPGPDPAPDAEEEADDPEAEPDDSDQPAGPLALPPGAPAVSALLPAPPPQPHPLTLDHTAALPTPPPQPAFVAPVGTAYRIQDLADGSRVVHVVGGDELDAADPAREQLDAVDILKAAEQALREALTAKQVQLPVSGISGSFTPYGQRWVITLTGGATVADVNGKLANLESAWGLPEGGAVYATPNPGGRKNEVVLTRVDQDPLDVVHRTPRVPYGSVSIKDPALIGRLENGQEDRISLLRRNIGIIAANRSGKSTLEWNLLNHLTACRDAIYWLIDLQGSASLRTWAKTAGRTAWTLDDARRLVQAAFEFAQVRAHQLGERAEAYIGEDGTQLEVNHDPTPEAPALVLVIDEGSLLADDKELIGVLLDLMRTGPKGCVTVVYANQRDEEGSTGSASIRKEFGERIMMRCEESDVDRFLGKPLRLAGFTPHLIRLQGVYYRVNFIDDPDRTPTPRRARTTWPDNEDMRAGIREALRHGRPTFRTAETCRVSIAMQPESFTEALSGVIYQLKARRQDRISTEDLRTSIQLRDPQAWSPLSTIDAGLSELNLTATSIKKPGTTNNMNGYYVHQLANALAGASSTGETSP
jgi:hypothetical protein